ncbi:MAG: WxcM protein [uncultured bacterium]|nr:MAG: WxcM protein [uncultured bacterium]
MSHKCKLFSLKNIQADNFLMTPLELKEYINFPVKRVYFISSPTGNTGNHAHRADEDEIFIQVQGQSTICVDDGIGMSEIILTGPKSAIAVPHLVWHGFKNLSPDCIILALTSTNYDPSRSDYIENYEEFKELCKKS